jgi:hypothetical protein
MLLAKIVHVQWKGEVRSTWTAGKTARGRGRRGQTTMKALPLEHARSAIAEKIRLAEEDSQKQINKQR